MSNVDHELVQAGLRWTSNILVELLGNYNRRVPLSVQQAMRKAVDALAEARSPQAWQKKQDQP